jgi:hypothetical protein
MRNRRWLVLPILLLFVTACLCTGVQNITNAVSTQLPGVLTSMPTAQGMIETLAAQATSSTCPSTPSAGGLGVQLERAKTVLQTTGQFSFTDGTVDNQPASTATLESTGASTFPAIANGFSAQFIGDPCNLTKILVVAPYTSDQATVDQGLAAANILFAAIIPVDVQLPFVTWLATDYSSLSVGDHKQTTIKNMQFTLSRSQTEMNLELVPAP